MAVAVFKQPNIVGEVSASNEGKGTRIRAVFSKLPQGKHGFHIHKAGDLRGEGCAGACEHFHAGRPCDHGGAPGAPRRRRGTAKRHTGDLGNIAQKGTRVARYSYYLAGIKPADLWGRSVIIHADEDDLGRGSHPDSKTTGHSGARIGCAIFGRIACSKQSGGATRKRSRKHRVQRGGVALEVLYGDKVVTGHSMTVEETQEAPSVKIINPQNIVNTTANSPPSFLLILHDSVDGGEPFYLHWVVSNIQYNNSFKVGAGDFEYFGPHPPAGDARSHKYAFQLYLQPSASITPAQAHGPFNLNEFKAERGLGEPIHEVFFTVGPEATNMAGL
jgi:Cu-Zn family superoxide dismutase